MNVNCLRSFSSQQVKLKPWERRLVDESLGSDVKSLLSKATDWEARYLNALPKSGEYNTHTLVHITDLLEHVLLPW